MVSSSQIMLGRADILDSMTTKVFSPIEDGNEADLTAQQQLIAISRARDEVAKLDAEHLIGNGLKRPLRPNAWESFIPNETANVYRRGPKEAKSRWSGGYRVVCMAGRHVALGRGGRLFKVPTSQVRGNALETVPEEGGERRHQIAALLRIAIIKMNRDPLMIRRTAKIYAWRVKRRMI